MSVVDLGASLRAERLRQGLSLREMARRLGISASALSQIETGKAQPSVGKLFDIVNLLNVSVDGLLAGQAVVARGDEGFVSLQRDGEHEALELESGVRWHRLTAGSYPGWSSSTSSTSPAAARPATAPSCATPARSSATC